MRKTAFLLTFLAFFFLFFSLVFPNPAQAAFYPPPNYGDTVPGPDVVSNSSYINGDVYQWQDTVMGTPLSDLSGEKFSVFLNDNNVNWIILTLGGPLDPSYRQSAYGSGAIAGVGNLVAGLVSRPPVSTAEYIADLGSNLGIVKPAYAQTSLGWQALTPVLNLWKAFRNIAYLIFVLIFVVIGFMIMFRAKINPQTVISVESAIPNLILTLILITFSYAIVSLLIDLIYVFIYLIIGVFSIAGLLQDQGQTTDFLLSNNLFRVVFSDGGVFAGQSANTIGRLVSSALGGDPDPSYPSIAGLLADPLATITHGIAYVIILIALFFTVFKLFFQLLISYVGIIMSVILAPFQLLLNAMPGSNGFVNWIKGLLANILVFPAVVFMFLLARVMIGVHGNIAGVTGNEWGINDITQVWTPNQVPWQPPLLLMSTDASLIGVLIALGIIMMTPKVVSMIKESLKVEKGAGIGAAIAPIVGVASLPGQAIGQGISIGQARQYIFPPKDRSQLGGQYGPPVGQTP